MWARCDDDSGGRGVSELERDAAAPTTPPAGLRRRTVVLHSSQIDSYHF